MAWKGKPIHLPCVSLGTFMTERFDQHGDRVAMVSTFDFYCSPPMRRNALYYSWDTLAQICRSAMCVDPWTYIRLWLTHFEFVANLLMSMSAYLMGLGPSGFLSVRIEIEIIYSLRPNHAFVCTASIISCTLL